MAFKEYPSIENHFRQKYIDYFLEKFPELESERFVIQEKIDGANFRIRFAPGEQMILGSRNQNLTELNKDHFGLRVVLKTFADELARLQGLADEEQRAFVIYGELFGPGIQQEIDYGAEKHVRFFDIWFDGDETPLPAMKFRELMTRLQLEPLTVDNLAVIVGLQAALEYDIAFNTTYNPGDAGVCEGVVIKPADKQYILDDAIFYLKKKNPQFLEAKERTVVEKPARAENIIEMHEAFLDYITPQRVTSVFSKEGKISSKAEIGKFLRLVSEDAIKDFLKDHDLSGVQDKDRKFILNASKEISQLLMKEL
ncbi:MAG TPA: RNA ligase family protein [Candidatus Lokiarchaeia archaeon]|nr:RNA ligase family protein [Candidatus Lokiarchaeia archaeon]